MQAAGLNHEETLMARAAWYYYYRGLTQQEIGARLGLTRVRVIRLLEKARECGIVRFQIRAQDGRRMEAEQALMERFHLKDCFLVPATDEASVNENVAQAAAMYLCDRITEDVFINIGYGDTMSRMINHLAQGTDHQISCVSLSGGVGQYLPGLAPGAFRARLYLIPAPLVASTKEMARAMDTEKSVRDIEQLIPLSFMTVLGIGALNENATILQAGALTHNDFVFLKRSGAIGDILSHFFDEDGRVLDTDIEERVISTPLRTIAALNNVVGVAAGASKVSAIRAALGGGYLNILISDLTTAEMLLAN